MWGARVLLVTVFWSANALADYKVNLVGPSTSLSASGESIQLTGGGSFDPDVGWVKLSGNFVVLTPEGKAIRRGTWRAQSVSKFTSWKHERQVGGVLEVMAILTENGRLDTERMRFTCLVNKPNTFAEDEGVTVGQFLESTGGVVRFQ